MRFLSSLKAETSSIMGKDKYILKNDGFTLLELLVAMAIVAVIAAIAIISYGKFIDQAKRQVSINAMSSLRKGLEDYATEQGKYPDGFDFSTCKDPDGFRIYPWMSCDALNKELFSLDTYTLTPSGYSITAKAKDSAQTVITITETSIIY
jgi:prepilin-type N-terminal cleavage/methylation domain-containing protein